MLASKLEAADSLNIRHPGVLESMTESSNSQIGRISPDERNDDWRECMTSTSTSDPESPGSFVCFTPSTPSTTSDSESVFRWRHHGPLVRTRTVRCRPSSPPALAVHRGRLWCIWVDTNSSPHSLWQASLGGDGIWSVPREVLIRATWGDSFPGCDGTLVVASLNGILHMVFKQTLRINSSDCAQAPLIHIQLDDHSGVWARRASLGCCNTISLQLVAHLEKLFLISHGHENTLHYQIWDDKRYWASLRTIPYRLKLGGIFTSLVMEGQLYLWVAAASETGSASSVVQLIFDDKTLSWSALSLSPEDEIKVGVFKTWYNSESFTLGHTSDLATATTIFRMFEDLWGKVSRDFNLECDGEIAFAAFSRSLICTWINTERTIQWSSLSLRASWSLSTWMSQIDSSSYLSEMSIPGSHESCALTPIPFVQCQHVPIQDQLDAGVRYLDFRCGVSFGKLYMFHGRSPLGFALHDILKVLYSWLEGNDTEAIMLQIKMEGGTGDSTQFEALIRSEISNHRARWALQDMFPMLGEVRGKIQLMRRFYIASGQLGIDVRRWADNSPSFTIPINQSDRLVVQDQYDFTDSVPTFAELIATKATAVDNQIRAAKLDQETRTWYLNWANAYAGPLSLGVNASPLDVALGRLEHVPRNGRRFVPGINFRLFEGNFSTLSKGRVGTILLDFLEAPNPNLIMAIIMTNPDISEDGCGHTASLLSRCGFHYLKKALL